MSVRHQRQTSEGQIKQDMNTIAKLRTHPRINETHREAAIKYLNENLGVLKQKEQEPFFKLGGKYISQQPSQPKHDSTYTSPNNVDHINFGRITGTPIQFIDSPTNAQIYADMTSGNVPQNNNTPPSFLDVLQRGNQPNNELPPFTANAFDDNLDWTNFSPQQPRL